MTLLNPRVDIAFKKIFGTEENKDLLISFINSIVSEEDQVTDIELLNPYNSRNFVGDKQSILDIKAKDLLGNYYNIEVQICDEGDYTERALLYWAKLYADQLRTGDPFSKLRRAIAIHVLNFTSIPNTPDYYNKFYVSNAKTGLRFFDHLEIHTIELNKFTPKVDEPLSLMLPRIKNGLDRWATFLTKAPSLDRNNLPKELVDPFIKKALDVLTNTFLNDEERELYEGHLKWLRIEASALEKAEKKAEARGKAEGRSEGKAEGRAEGKAEGKAEMARDLLNLGFPISAISKASGLSEEDIKAL